MRCGIDERVQLAMLREEALGADGHVAVMERPCRVRLDQPGHHHDAIPPRDGFERRGPTGRRGRARPPRRARRGRGAGGTCNRRSQHSWKLTISAPCSTARRVSASIRERLYALSLLRCSNWAAAIRMSRTGVSLFSQNGQWVSPMVRSQTYRSDAGPARTPILT